MGTRYSWQGSSPIKQIEVVKNLGEQVEATIYAPDAVDSKLAALPQYLTQHGFIPYHLDEVGGKHVIRIVDLDDKEAKLIIDALSSDGFVSGQASVTDIDDSIKKLSRSEQLKQNSLNIAGGLGSTGHVAGIVQGAMEGGPQGKSLIATSALYGVSSVVNAVYGNGTNVNRFAEMVSRAQDDLAKKGFALPPSSYETPVAQFRKRTLSAKTSYLLKIHPIQIANFIGAAGDVALLNSGVQKFRENLSTVGKQEKFLLSARFVNGLLMTTGAVLAMLVPEKTKEEIEEDKKKKGVMQTLGEGKVLEAIKIIPNRVLSLVARKPLAVQGTFLTIGNAFGLVDTIHVTKNPPPNNPLAPAFAWFKSAVYTGSALFNTASSKNAIPSLQKGGKYDSLYAYAANTLLELPENQHEQATKEMASHLATHYKHDLHAQAEEMGAGITSKLEILQKSPWRKNVIAVEEATTTENSAVPADARKESKPWTEKVAQASAAVPATPFQG